MSLTDLTTRAGWIAGLAILALVFLGWRKTARAAPRSVRGRRPSRQGVVIAAVPAPTYRRTPIWRRIWALSSASVLTVLAGAVIAIVTAFALSWLLTTLSELLKK